MLVSKAMSIEFDSSQSHGKMASSVYFRVFVLVACIAAGDAQASCLVKKSPSVWPGIGNLGQGIAVAPVNGIISANFSTSSPEAGVPIVSLSTLRISCTPLVQHLVVLPYFAMISLAPRMLLLAFLAARLVAPPLFPAPFLSPTILSSQVEPITHRIQEAV